MRPSRRTLLGTASFLLLACLLLASNNHFAAAVQHSVDYCKSHLWFSAPDPMSQNNDTTLKFPDGFMWGTATASYQIEGGSDKRLETIWDRFSSIEGNVRNGDTGQVACDHYHRYKEDVQLIKKLNTKYYRFSIAWGRIHTFPTLDAPQLNEEGVQFYNMLIDELIRNGITPVATLYHWDLPVQVEDGTGGWSGERGGVSKLFAKYAMSCFEQFGDRVKIWITLNEPWCSSVLGYEIGEHAPGNTSEPGRAVYRAGHELLLAHGRAVQVYREEFQEKQGGKIGITLNTVWAEAKDRGSTESVEAAQRDMDFELGWFADPIWKGDYPESMRESVGDRLPRFSEEEKEMLKGSSDFFGLNHYSSQYTVGRMEAGQQEGVGYYLDRGTRQEWDEKWGKTDMGWAIVPWGFRELLVYIQNRYDPKGGIIVTENGLAAAEPTREDMTQNETRIKFYSDYIQAMHQAMQQGADVRGYFLWSLLDNFEWAFGYEKRFGLYWIDYNTLERVAKPGSIWYANLVKNNALST